MEGNDRRPKMKGTENLRAPLYIHLSRHKLIYLDRNNLTLFIIFQNNICLGYRELNLMTALTCTGNKLHAFLLLMVFSTISPKLRLSAV
jgi:hypothetical protein